MKTGFSLILLNKLTLLVIFALITPSISLAINCSQALQGKTSFMVRANFDEAGVYIYQAYSDRIANDAVEKQTFVQGSGFKFSRMTWLKLSLGWMAYRANYGKNQGQERILRIKITHEFFKALLKAGVMSEFSHSGIKDKSSWNHLIKESDVVFQWDPDRDLRKQPLAAKVLQIGIRRKVLLEFATSAILEITDITTELQRYRDDAYSSKVLSHLYEETTYPLTDELYKNLIF